MWSYKPMLFICKQKLWFTDKSENPQWTSHRVQIGFELLVCLFVRGGGGYNNNVRGGGGIIVTLF